MVSEEICAGIGEGIQVIPVTPGIWGGWNESKIAFLLQEIFGCSTELPDSLKAYVRVLPEAE